MSSHDSSSDLPAFRSQLSGVHRSNTNPRPHSSSKPYARPAQNASPEKEQNGGPSGLRPGLVKSHSSSTLSRSGSEPSLFSGIKSIISRPLAWFSTPSKPAPAARGGTTGKKRDSYASFGPDVEDAPSPSATREGKRARQVSPPRQRGAYDPDHISIMGQAVTGTMLPPLSPGVSLSAKRNTPHRDTNFSRPLASSKSMPYLDPPSAALSPSRRGLAKGPLSRSRRSDLQKLANDDMEDPQPVPELPNPESWSPWKDRYRNSMTPRAQTPVRSAERDFALPSLSPFKAPPPHASTSSLVRSATVGSHLRRASSVATDVSMGGAESPRLQRRSLYSTLPETQEVDDRMSVDGDQRDGSVLDWVMRDRWTGVPGSPASVAASRRLGSVTPSMVGAPPIRKGQLVWAGEKGFVRESELETPEPTKPVPRNEAEAILYALESSRNTPVAAARASTSSLPASLIGSSSREIRKAINVPMATAQAGDTARKRRERERLGEDHNVMISPYGRRQQVDRAVRDVQRARSTSAMEEDDHRMARSSSAISSTSSADHLSVSEREGSTTPVPTPRRSSRLRKATSPLPEETPQPHRRSRKTSAGLKDANIESTTPRATPSRKRRSTQDKPSSPPPAVPPFPTIIETAASPDQKSTYQPRADGELPKGQSSLRAKSDNKRKHEASASYNSSRATSPAGGRFSAKEEDLPNMEELENQPKISLGGFTGFNFAPAPPAASEPKATAQSSGSSKSSLAAPSNNGRPGAGPLSRLNASRPRAPSPLASGTSIVPAPGSPDSASTASAEPKAAENGMGFFPLSTSNSGTTTPAAKPLFASVSTDKEEGRPAKRSAIGLGKPSQESKEADTNGEVPDFFGMKSKTATPAASEPSSGAASPPTTFNFGTAPKAAPAEIVKPAPSSGGFSFGTPTSKPADSGSTNGGFSFGASEPAETAASAPSFSFGKKDETVKPASTPPFSFGKPSASTSSTDTAEKPKAAFSFGTPSTTDKPSESSKPAFSFGTPSAKPADKPNETAKPAFSFGTPAASKPAHKPAEKSEETAKPAFSFGTPAKTEETKAPAASTPFSFGASSSAHKADESKKDAEKPAASFSFGASSAKPAEDKSKPAFSFGGAVKPAEETKTPSFSFGTPAKPAEEPKPAASTGFSFGSSSTTKPTETPKSPPPTDKPAFSFGASAKASEPAKPAFSFGANSSTIDAPKGDAAAKPAFSFGTPAASSTPSTGFSFGASAKPASPPKPASTPFGSNTAPSSGGFNFGSSAPAPTPFGAKADTPNPFGAPSTEAPKSNPFASPPATAAATNPFSSPSSPAATPTSGFSFGQAASNNTNGSAAPFTFGASSNAPPPYSATSGGFGAQSTTPATTPGFNFGASAAPSSGFGNSNGFGGSTTTSNAFGTSTTPAASTNAAGGFNFNFGTSTPAATSTPSTPFVFGAGQPSTPSATPASNPFGGASTQAATFSFGQSAPTPNANPVATGFSFGSSGTPANGGVRFASPAPESGGGFSLGTGGDAPPGSPGGRQIKPLRKPRR